MLIMEISTRSSTWTCYFPYICQLFTMNTVAGLINWTLSYVFAWFAVSPPRMNKLRRWRTAKRRQTLGEAAANQPQPLWMMLRRQT